MPDDFKAQPNPLPPGVPPSLGRYEDVDFRKPEGIKADVRSAAIIRAVIALVLFAVPVSCFVLSRKPPTLPGVVATPTNSGIDDIINPGPELTDSPIAGSWVANHAIIDGEEVAGKVSLSVNRFLYILESPRKATTGVVIANTQTAPNQVDFSAGDGDILAIYSKSKETLTICMNLTAKKDRPSAFTAAKGSGRMLVTLNRE